MSHDATFRIVLIASALAIFPVAFYHRLRSRTAERLDRRQEGLFILLTLRPLGLAGMLGLLAYMVKPSSMAWSSVDLPPAWRWAGAGLGVLAGGLLLWAFSSLGKNLTDTVVTRQDHSLITSGPYRFVRHPFYDAMALAILANSLVTANWFILTTGALAFALIVLRTRREEERLIARFGDDYRRFMVRTGRFLPRLGARSEG